MGYSYSPSRLSTTIPSGGMVRLTLCAQWCQREGKSHCKTIYDFAVLVYTISNPC